MLDQQRDDSPTAYRLARRDIVFGGVVLVGGLATGLVPTTSALAAWSDEASARFMEISSLLISHRLHEEVGKRIGAAMGALNLALSQQVTELLAIAKNKNARIVEDFFPDVPDGPLKETALAIISAWYLGVVKDADGGEVFAFEYALMYGPTSDVMTIPSYAISGPNAWPPDAPPLENMPDF
jgi:fructose 5-dehydrogenase small subunit